MRIKNIEIYKEQKTGNVVGTIIKDFPVVQMVLVHLKTGDLGVILRNQKILWEKRMANDSATYFNC